MEGEWGLWPAALVMNMLLTGRGAGGGGCDVNPCAIAVMASASQQGARREDLGELDSQRRIHR
jgi:hypothetical protein